MAGTRYLPGTYQVLEQHIESVSSARQGPSRFGMRRALTAISGGKGISSALKSTVCIALWAAQISLRHLQGYDLGFWNIIGTYRGPEGAPVVAQSGLSTA